MLLAEGNAGKLLQPFERPRKLVVDPLDLELNRIEHIHEIILRQMCLHRVRGLVHLADAIPEGSVLVADVVDELLELLRLQTLHAGDRAVVDERFKFVSHEKKPVEVLVNCGEAEQLSLKCLLFETIEESPRLNISLLADSVATFVSTFRGSQKRTGCACLLE